MNFSWYSVLMLLAIVGSFFFWRRLARRNDELIVIYLAALGGAFLGAKLVYLFAEGWLHLGEPQVWQELATGKSILGALLGGYLAVELTKRWVGYRAPTGDWFAMIVPLAVIVGRVGCLVHGCCLGRNYAPAWYTMNDLNGQPRWPAVPIEMLFNALAVVAFLVLRRQRILANQHFHLYLIAYGIFRFAHETLRDTPRIAFALSGYQLAALAVAAVGAVGFVARRRSYSPSNSIICTQRLL